MATVALKLDCRRQECQVKVYMSASGGKTFFAGIGIRLDSREQFDEAQADMGCPVIKHLRARLYNSICASRLTMARQALEEVRSSKLDKDITIEELKIAYYSRVDPDKAATMDADEEKKRRLKCSVYSAFSGLMSQKSGRTYELYEITYKKVMEFVKSQGHDEPAAYLRSMQVDDITMAWVDGFEAHLAKTMTVNARSIHLRNLRAVCNYAIDYDLATKYIWRRRSISYEETEKRALTHEEFTALFTFDMSKEKAVCAYRDMALLSFYLGGMNLVDMYAATADCVRDGYLYYKRAKTARLYKIPIYKEAAALINRYKSDDLPEVMPLGGESQPVMPYGVKLLKWAGEYKDHKSYMKHLNQHGLQRVGPVTRSPGRGGMKEWHPILPDVTIYSLRHTLATFAYNDCGCSKDDIAALLGHGKKTVTDTYIKEDQRHVDSTLRSVIDFAVGLLTKKKKIKV